VDGGEDYSFLQLYCMIRESTRKNYQNYEKGYRGEEKATSHREPSSRKLTLKRLIEALDHISAAVTISVEGDRNTYGGTWRRKMAGRVSA
jgi:hypothetical protein